MSENLKFGGLWKRSPEFEEGEVSGVDGIGKYGSNIEL
jgi:hypothetical protein